jgi:catechol 2,3-dioxygenase-like lactoylglutathione lyase family enzyme
MKVTSLVFWVADATLSYKFYKKLGFEVVEVMDRHAIVSCAGFEIQLITMRDEAEFNKDSLSASKGEGLYVYIQVEDVDKKYNEALEKGLIPSSEPRDWEWGNREFVIKDPDGYKLCFWQTVRVS